MDWLTPSLVEEIEEQFPVATGIDVTNHNQCDYDAYLMKIAIVCFLLKGNLLASNSWSIVEVHYQKKICCFYGPSTKKK
jgi:hypothetical protein